jgi:hypothetical protein
MRLAILYCITSFTSFGIMNIFRPVFELSFERKVSICRLHFYMQLITVAYTFKACNFVHHRTIQINHLPDVKIFQIIILTFIYSSTCFGCYPAHHQEPNDCSSNLWFFLRIVVIAVLCSWSGRPAGPTTNTARLSPRYEGKTRGCYCSHLASDDGRENARNTLSYK